MLSRGWIPVGFLVMATFTMTFFAVAVMQESFSEWRTEWAWGWVQWAAQVQLTAPLTGGLAAWVVYDAQRAGRAEWLATMPRGNSVLRWHALCSVLPALATAVLTGVILPFALEESGPASWPLQLSLAVTAAVVGAGALGAVLGRLLPFAFTPLVVSILLWALVVGLVPLAGAWLRVAGAGHTLAGYEVNSMLAWQRWVACALVVALLILALTAQSPRQWALARKVAFSIATFAAIAVVGGTGWFSGTYDVRPSASAKASDCANGSGVEVCLMPEHAAASAAAQRSLGAIVQARRDLGITTPDLLVQLTPYQMEVSNGVDSGRDGSKLDFTLGGKSAQAVAGGAQTLVLPSRCFAAFDRIDANHLRNADEGFRVLGLWAAIVAGQPVAEGSDDPAWLSFVSLPPASQRAWLRSAILSADACDYGSIPGLGS